MQTTPVTPHVTAARSGDPEPARQRVAIYARYSTDHQHSTEDQIRECRKWANANDLDGDGALIFQDPGKSGSVQDRPGYQAMRAALTNDEFDVLLVFSTSRLMRSQYLCLRFLEEDVLPNRKRCVFIAQLIDTAAGTTWKQLLALHSMLDESLLSSQLHHIRIGQVGVFEKGFICGSLCYGFTGETVPDATLTRRGRYRQRVVVNEAEKTVLRGIFDAYVNGGLAIRDITRRLRDRSIPPPRRAREWTNPVVSRILSNPKCMGCFSFGKTERTRHGGKLKVAKRQEPLATRHFAHLEIITPDLFLKAQDRRRFARFEGGRRRHRDGIDLTKRIFWCQKHDCYLVTNGNGLHCRHCKAFDAQENTLYSNVNRAIAEERLVDTVARVLRSAPNFVVAVTTAMQAAVARLQQPDPGDLRELKSRRERLNTQINFITDNLGTTPEDLEESRQKLTKARSEREKISRELQHLEHMLAHTTVRVPTAKEARAHVEQMHSVLSAAAKGDGTTRAKLRQIIEMVTGGKVTMRQEGEDRAKRGWLVGSFVPQFARLIVDHPVASDVDAGRISGVSPVEIDFRRHWPIDELSERVKVLADQGMLLCSIADELGVTPTRTTLAWKRWYLVRGQPIPNGTARRAKLPPRTPPLYQRVADEAARATRAGELIQDVAQRLGVDRNTITSALKHWYQKAGVPMPAGKGRRRPPLIDASCENKSTDVAA